MITAKRFVDEDPDSPYRIDNLQNGGEYWTGDLMMLRMNEDLTKGTKAGGREKIVLKNDEGLVEGTAMLYYPATRTVIFHENRFAGKMSRVAWFFNQFSTGNRVELRPIMRKETLERLERIQPYYFEVQLAGVDTTRELKDRSLPAKQFFQLLNTLKAPKALLRVEVPKRRGKHAAQQTLDNIVSFVSGIAPAGSNGEDVRKIVVRGLDPETDMAAEAVVNLLNDTLVESEKVEIRSRRATDADRHQAVASAFKNNRAYLDAFYTKS